MSVSTTYRFARRNALFVIAASPVFAALVGSVFNIWYNVSQVEPLLTAEQNVAFHKAILLYNIVAYPPLIAWWLAAVMSLVLA